MIVAHNRGAWRFLAVVLVLWSLHAVSIPGAFAQTGPGEAERQAGLAFLREGQFGNAVEAYERALEVEPDAERTYLELADIFLAAGLASDAEGVLVRARTRFPDSMSPNYNLLFHDLAELQVQLGRIGKAREAMAEASRVEGPIAAAQVHKRLGDFSTDLLRFDEAEVAYQRSLELDRRNAEAGLALANLYLRRNDLDAASAEFTRLIESGWEGADVQHGIAELHWRRGELGEAVLAAGRVLRMNPAHRGALYIRGSALIRMGSRDTGEDALEEYRRLESIAQAEEHRRRDIRSFRAGGLDLVRKRQYEEAIEWFRRGIEAYPLADELYLGLGQAQSESGRHQDAAATYMEWLEMGLDNGDTAYQNLLREYSLIEQAQGTPDPE